MKGAIIYYTDNRVVEPIFSKVQEILTAISKEKALEISSCSLRPIDFGNNIVLENRQRSYPTMIRQIIMALENTDADYVFFCENDVLYHPSHFDFIPPKDDIFYYNDNVWRWKLWDNKAIQHDGMIPLSCLCGNRNFILTHFKLREEKICKHLDEFRSREPRMSRIWGYEPGRKPKRRGGLTDDVAEFYHSKLPNIDIRHARTFSRLKCSPKDFKHQPTGWIEIDYTEIPGWNLDKVFPEKITYDQTYK